MKRIIDYNKLEEALQNSTYFRDFQIKKIFEILGEVEE